MSRRLFIKYSDLSCHHLKTGDVVKCVRSTVDGREGTKYIVSQKTSISKAARANGHAELWWLKHCENYGDKFEKI